MKKVAGLILLLICSSFVGMLCGEYSESNNSIENTRIYANASLTYNGIDSVLDSADLIVEAMICDITENGQYSEYHVKVENILKGDYTGEYLDVRNYYFNYAYEYEGNYYNGRTHTNYAVDEKYLFVLQHIDSLYDERYIIVSDAYVPVTETTESSILSNPIDEGVSAVQYIEEYSSVATVGDGEKLSIPYIKSEDTEEIILNSQYIIEIEIEELNTTSNTSELYLCNVLDVLKGDINTTQDDKIYVVFFRGTVVEGERYIVMLNSDTNTSLLYTLSSKNSVYDLKHKEMIIEYINER